MSKETDIRRAISGDVEAITSVFSMARKHNLPYLPILHTHSEDLGYFKTVVNDQAVIVSEHDHRLVGFCAYDNSWLNHLYISPEYQGIGIGKTLLERAKAANSELNLWVFQKNTNAIAFYEKNGFSLVEKTDGQRNEEREPDAHYIWHQQ